MIEPLIPTDKRYFEQRDMHNENGMKKSTIRIICNHKACCNFYPSLLDFFLSINPTPESTNDRMTLSFEVILCLDVGRRKNKCENYL